MKRTIKTGDRVVILKGEPYYPPEKKGLVGDRAPWLKGKRGMVIAIEQSYCRVFIDGRFPLVKPVIRWYDKPYIRRLNFIERLGEQIYSWLM